MEPLFRGHPDERPTSLERSLDNVLISTPVFVLINVLISTPQERPLLLKGQFSVAKGVTSQEGCHCISWYHNNINKIMISVLSVYTSLTFFMHPSNL